MTALRFVHNGCGALRCGVARGVVFAATYRNMWHTRLQHARHRAPPQRKATNRIRYERTFIRKMLSIQNAAARLITGMRRHATTLCPYSTARTIASASCPASRRLQSRMPGAPVVQLSPYVHTTVLVTEALMLRIRMGVERFGIVHADRPPVSSLSSFGRHFRPGKSQIPLC